jgi:type IV pilus assembly protein PilZ
VSGPTDSDKRNTERLPIRMLVEYESSEDFLIDYTANMSIGGMFIQTSNPLEVGTRFRLRFRIPGRDEPVDTVGEVCWVLTQEEAGCMQPGMGVRFEELAGIDRDAVESMLEAWE